MLIFLDLDGVMIPAKPWKQPGFHADGIPLFSSVAVAALNTLLRFLKVEVIMLTSSHKSSYPAAQWREMFRLRGIDVCPIACLPENLDNLSRREEIENWLAENPLPGGFLIIDDDATLHELSPEMKRHFLQPSAMIGFTPELVQDFAGDRRT